jgi:prepilin-type processing-associated H-X9-DG protein
MPSRRLFVPFLVVVLAAALWLWPAGETEVVELSDDVRACSANLRALYQDLVTYEARSGRTPAASGPAFLSVPLEQSIVEGTVEDTPAERARLACPGAGRPYAGRDALAHPLARFPAGGAEIQALAACDGAGRLPHAEGVNVLYSDGSVQMLLLAQELEQGRLPAGTTTIAVGPDSPLPELRSLATH